MRASQTRGYFSYRCHVTLARYPWKKANEAIILLFLPFSPLYSAPRNIAGTGLCSLYFYRSLFRFEHYIYLWTIKFANNINDSSRLNIVLIRIGGRI